MSESQSMFFDSTLHAAHFWDVPSVAVTRWLYETAVLAKEQHSEFWTNDHAWARHRLYQSPPVVWQVVDLLNENPSISLDTPHVLVLPNNTNLDSGALLLKKAVAAWGANVMPSAEIERPCKVGDVVEVASKGAGRYDKILHFVCREPGKKAVVGLDKCMRSLCDHLHTRFPASFPTCVVLPLWGEASELSTWVDAIASLCSIESALQSRQLRILFGVPTQDVERAQSLQRMLIGRGVLSAHRAKDELPPSGTSPAVGKPLLLMPEFRRQLASMVRPEGPLTPDIYADWLYGGVALKEEEWTLVVDAVR